MSEENVLFKLRGKGIVQCAWGFMEPNSILSMAVFVQIIPYLGWNPNTNKFMITDVFVFEKYISQDCITK